jgi:hypothetical protein
MPRKKKVQTKKLKSNDEHLLEEMQMQITKARLVEEAQTLEDLSSYLRYCMDGKPRKRPQVLRVFDYSNGDDGRTKYTPIVGKNVDRRPWWSRAWSKFTSWFSKIPW